MKIDRLALRSFSEAGAALYIKDSSLKEESFIMPAIPSPPLAGGARGGY
jgi:hypothetical protein